MPRLSQEDLNNSIHDKSIHHTLLYLTQIPIVSEGHKWEETIPMRLLTDLVTYCVRKGQGVFQSPCSSQLQSQDSV